MYWVRHRHKAGRVCPKPPNELPSIDSLQIHQQSGRSLWHSWLHPARNVEAGDMNHIQSRSGQYVISQSQSVCVIFSCELNSKCKDLTSQCESKAQGKKSFPGFQGSNPKLPLFQFHFNFHVSQYKSPTGLVFGILGVMSSVWEWCNSAALRWICGKMGALARTSSLNADSMWLV